MYLFVVLKLSRVMRGMTFFSAMEVPISSVAMIVSTQCLAGEATM
jgi:hypothetical protein